MARVATALGTAVAAGLTALTVACADAPTSPAAAPNASAAPARATATTSGSTLVGVTMLQRTTALPAAITRSITLTGVGGVLQIPEAGLTVTIPRGAVGDTTVRITATALAGKSVAYEFQPHGAKFLTQLKVLQDLNGTSWAGNTGTMQVAAGYFADPAQLYPATNTALINEFLPVSVDLQGANLRVDVRHFSGYMMSSGRY
jgi:hypothetical protein